MDVSVVIATRDRCPRLLETLEHLHQLPERPHVVVVDNGSGDGTAAAVNRHFPETEVVALGENRGTAGRTAGILATSTRYVALTDDDSWWEPGALGRAALRLDRQPDLALVAGRVLVGPDDRLDPTCTAMAAGRPSPMLPGCTDVLGFLACAAVVRRSAYLGVGGFHPRLVIGSEEELLALDLAAAGWGLVYDPEVVAHHHPSAARDVRSRRRLLLRNKLWVAWLRRPAGCALSVTAGALREARHQPGAWTGIADAVAGAGWVWRERRVLPPAVERARRCLDGIGATVAG